MGEGGLLKSIPQAEPHGVPQNAGRRGRGLSGERPLGRETAAFRKASRVHLYCSLTLLAHSRLGFFILADFIANPGRAAAVRTNQGQIGNMDGRRKLNFLPGLSPLLRAQMLVADVNAGH